MKSIIGKWLVGLRNNTMVCKHRMGDDGHVPLGHVTAGTIIRRIFSLSNSERHRATLFRVTRKTSSTEIGRGFLGPGLYMRIMTTDATKLAIAVPITLAKTHREVVLEQIIFRSRTPLKRNQEQAEGIVKRRTGPKITILFSCLGAFNFTRVAAPLS